MKKDAANNIKMDTMGLGMKTPKEPAAKMLEGGQHNHGLGDNSHMSRAVKMVEMHNERGEHAPTVCGHKMDDMR